jgi:hypothetical protein
LKQIRALKQDFAINRQKHNQPLRVAVKNRIDDIHEANQIFQEVGELDPKTLGRLKVVGLRLKWQRSGAVQFECEEFLPFGGKS